MFLYNHLGLSENESIVLLFVFQKFLFNLLLTKVMLKMKKKKPSITMSQKTQNFEKNKNNTGLSLTSWTVHTALVLLIKT